MTCVGAFVDVCNVLWVITMVKIDDTTQCFYDNWHTTIQGFKKP